MFLQIVLLMAIGGYAVTGQFNTSSCPEFDSKINKCLTDIDLTLPMDIQPLVLIHGLFLQETTEICGSSKDKYKNAVGCSIDLLRGCVSDNDKILVASSSNYKEAFDLLCNDGPTERGCVGDYLKSCFDGKMNDAGLDIRRGPSRNVTYDVRKNHMCKQAEYYLTCVNENPGKPACRTASIEIDRKILTKLTPEACAAMSIIYTSLILAASLFVTVGNVIV